MAWTAFQMQKIAYDTKIMEQNICRGADPSRNTARGSGRVRDAAFFPVAEAAGKKHAGSAFRLIRRSAPRALKQRLTALSGF